MLIAGINDLKSGDASERVASATNSIVEMMRMSDAAEVPLEIAEIWGRGDVLSARSLLFPSDLSSRIEEVNAGIHAAATVHGANTFPVNELLTPDGLIARSWAKDDLHLNDEGNQRLASIIASRLPPPETEDD